MFLAIDTSCYTTSIALVDNAGRLIADERRLLAVEKGCLGLRQNDALFAHHHNMPQLIRAAFSQIDEEKLTAIAVSTSPRPIEGSYMPVFNAGAGIARIIAATHQLPLYQFSHQEGHLAAALWSADLTWQEPFLALHLSGGTGEILQVTPIANSQDNPEATDAACQPAVYQTKIIGDSDLAPGQFVDRVGVALGYAFPAGAALDKLALKAANKDFRLSGSVKGTHISFSGPESAAQRAIKEGIDPSQIAAAVFDNIGKSLTKAIIRAQEISGIKKVLLMGGVAASENLRLYLRPRKVEFALPKYSSDNAVGLAYLVKKLWK